MLVLAMYSGGYLSLLPLEVVWILLVSALATWLARGHRQMESRFLALYRLGHLFSSTLRESQVLEISVRELAASWPGCNCYVAKLNSSGEFSVVASSRQNFSDFKLDLGNVITTKLVEEKEPVAIKNTLRDKCLTSDFLNRFYLKSVLLAPVVAQGRTTGLVLIESSKIREFNHYEMNLIMLASSQMGICLENARLYERMEELARYDELTGIYNRRAFHEVAEAELGQSQRKNIRLSLVMVDIDHFKQINDHWGHQVGDQVLIQLAELMKQTLRADDSVCRFGGEEFVIILPGADCSTALQVAERIRRAVEGANWRDGLKVTVSAGVASYPENGDNLTELMKNADRALYQAKSGGRNQARRT
ncbi:MAG: sensor domain-containing diguanylate cyclase [Bacillota bacterium]